MFISHTLCVVDLSSLDFSICFFRWFSIWNAIMITMEVEFHFDIWFHYDFFALSRSKYPMFAWKRTRSTHKNKNTKNRMKIITATTIIIKCQSVCQWIFKRFNPRSMLCSRCLLRPLLFLLLLIWCVKQTIEWVFNKSRSKGSSN